MTTRTLTLTGNKLGTDPAAIRVTIQPWLFYNGNNHFMGQDEQQNAELGQELEVFSGPVTNNTVGTLCTHSIQINDIDLNEVDNNEIRSAILQLTSGYLVKVYCTQGRVSVYSVTSPALNDTDQFAVVPDPLWFVDTYPLLHQEFNRAAPPPSTRESTLDPKFDVRLNNTQINVTAQDDDQGPWAHEVAANSLLEFKIMIRNLIAFKQPGFIPPMILWQQLEKPLRGETYGEQ